MKTNQTKEETAKRLDDEIDQFLEKKPTAKELKLELDHAHEFIREYIAYADLLLHAADKMADEIKGINPAKTRYEVLKKQFNIK
jgi:methylthioribose-1-phosphate isomerase